ncbi:hypothetical protein TEU_00040 [Thermococcus eurythermalis]|uniref:Uncharacterized protein n=1 Tax=Thermococcus eurythermalis TaxID=1505907 RepID=A0A097QQW0_9EURY|nr:hypothetical protein [Thermococcus eurythermalis]AIU68850.1 hypothetical protein TEU_00040 [Thermococcus eurythermalis]
MEALLELLREEMRRPLTPEVRVRDFLKEIRRKNGEEIEVEGFLLLRQPPNAPRDAVYYLLSPLSPEEARKTTLRAYLVLWITEASSIGGSLYSGAYVRAKGVLDAYPYGNLRLLHVRELKEAPYENRWLRYEEYALSRGELEGLISDTIYANYETERAIIYSLLSAPTVIGAGNWGEGVTFSAFKGERERSVLSLWEALKYLHSLLPEELKLRRDRWTEFDDDFLSLDFRFARPRAKLAYYVPHTRAMLKRPRPVPKWAEEHFRGKNAGFLSPRLVMKPEDETATLGEAPLVITEDVAYERNRELEELIPNVVATVMVARRRVGVLNLGEMEDYRYRFEAFLIRNRNEYGELFDALTLSGKVFNVGLRYRLGARLLGAMGRFEGKLRRGLISDLLGLYQEITDTWINELPDREKLRLLKEYERYIGNSRVAEIGVRIFEDLEATSIDGTVTREEFLKALIEAGFRREHAGETLEKLLREGYIYEPFPGKLKLVRW